MKIPIGPEGHFSAVLPETGIGSWMIQTAKGYQFFDLVSGQSLSVEADFSRPEPLQVLGDHEGDFHFVAWLNQAVKDAAAEPLALTRLEPWLRTHRFCRIHPLYLVALDQIRAFDQHRIELPGAVLPLAKPYAAVLKARVQILAPPPAARGPRLAISPNGALIRRPR